MNVTLALSAAAAEWVKRMSTSLGRRREKLRPAGDQERGYHPICE